MSNSTVGAGAREPVTIDHLPPRWEPIPARPRLPVGVAIVSVFVAALAVVMVLAGVLFFLGVFLPNVVPVSLEVFSSVDLYGAAILVVLGAALLGIATSLWNQETWSLWTTIVLVFATAAYLFFTGSITVLFLIFVVLFVYLISVRRYFY